MNFNVRSRRTLHEPAKSVLVTSCLGDLGLGLKEARFSRAEMGHLRNALKWTYACQGSITGSYVAGEGDFH